MGKGASPRPGGLRAARVMITAALCLGGLLAAVSAAPRGVELRVTPVAGGPPLLVLPLNVGERFTIAYNHSVEDAPIRETHSVDASGKIYIEEEAYLRFGAGMGKMPGVGRMVMRGPWEVITDMHWPTGDFVLRIGSPGVDHTVIWRGTATNLSRIAPHRAVRFKAHSTRLWYRLFRALRPHSATPRLRGAAGPRPRYLQEGSP